MKKAILSKLSVSLAAVLMILASCHVSAIPLKPRPDRIDSSTYREFFESIQDPIEMIIPEGTIDVGLSYKPYQPVYVGNIEIGGNLVIDFLPRDVSPVLIGEIFPVIDFISSPIYLGGINIEQRLDNRAGASISFRIENSDISNIFLIKIVPNQDGQGLHLGNEDIAAVSEPATLGLLALGTTALLMLRCHRY